MTTSNLFLTLPNFQTAADAAKDIFLVESLEDPLYMDMSEMELDSIVASVAVSALMRNEVTLGGTSTPKHPRPSMTKPQNPVTLASTTIPKCIFPSTSAPQALKKNLKLNTAIGKVMNMNSSDISLLE